MRDKDKHYTFPGEMLCTLMAQCDGGNPGRDDEILTTGQNVYLYKL